MTYRRRRGQGRHAAYGGKLLDRPGALRRAYGPDRRFTSRICGRIRGAVSGPACGHLRSRTPPRRRACQFLVVRARCAPSTARPRPGRRGSPTCSKIPHGVVNSPTGSIADLRSAGQASGVGRELGPSGIDEFVNKKLIYVSGGALTCFASCRLPCRALLQLNQRVDPAAIPRLPGRGRQRPASRCHSLMGGQARAGVAECWWHRIAAERPHLLSLAPARASPHPAGRSRRPRPARSG